MTNPEKAEHFQNRLLSFSVSIVKLAKNTPIDLTNRNIFEQLLKSSTSIGANYVEANNASSRADFRSKIFLAKKEASETRYWLKLLSQTYERQELEGLIDEISQIIMTLQTIISTMKNKQMTN